MNEVEWTYFFPEREKEEEDIKIAEPLQEEMTGFRELEAKNRSPVGENKKNRL